MAERQTQPQGMNRENVRTQGKSQGQTYQAGGKPSGGTFGQQSQTEQQQQYFCEDCSVGFENQKKLDVHNTDNHPQERGARENRAGAGRQSSRESSAREGTRRIEKR